MVSKRAIGQKHVNEAMKVYISRRYRVWKPGNKAIFIGPGRAISASQDIAQCFDFMAWNDDNLDFVQVKTNVSDVSKAKRWIEQQKLPEFRIVDYVILRRIKGHPYYFDKWVLVTGSNPLRQRWWSVGGWGGL